MIDVLVANKVVASKMSRLSRKARAATLSASMGSLKILYELLGRAGLAMGFSCGVVVDGADRVG